MKYTHFEVWVNSEIAEEFKGDLLDLKRDGLGVEEFVMWSSKDGIYFKGEKIAD